jgi:hypothetical protein
MTSVFSGDDRADGHEEQRMAGSRMHEMHERGVRRHESGQNISTHIETHRKQCRRTERRTARCTAKDRQHTTHNTQHSTAQHRTEQTISISRYR